MTIEQLYRSECDTIRLLIDELNSVGAEYILRNQERINKIVATDMSQYVKPETIPTILGFFAGSLLVHAMSLLDFRLPLMINWAFRSLGKSEPSPFKGGSVLEWMKKSIEKEPSLDFDFEDDLTKRIRAWMRVRNDEVHNGGYRSERTSQDHLDLLKGVFASEVGSLYEIQFGACSRAIDDVEQFFSKTEKLFT